MKSQEKIILTLVSGAITITAIIVTKDLPCIILFIVGMAYLWS